MLHREAELKGHTLSPNYGTQLLQLREPMFLQGGCEPVVCEQACGEGFKCYQPTWPWLSWQPVLHWSGCFCRQAFLADSADPGWAESPCRWRDHCISGFDTSGFQDWASRINIFISGLARKSLRWPAEINLPLRILSQDLKANDKCPLNWEHPLDSSSLSPSPCCCGTGSTALSFFIFSENRRQVILIRTEEYFISMPGMEIILYTPHLP